MKQYTSKLMIIIIAISLAFLINDLFQLNIIWVYGISLLMLFAYNTVIFTKKKVIEKKESHLFKLSIGITYLIITIILLIIIPLDLVETTITYDSYVVMLIFSILYSGYYGYLIWGKKDKKGQKNK